jgi:hypothetical protein
LHRLLAGGRSELLGNDLDLPDPRRFVWLAGVLTRVLHDDVSYSCGYGWDPKGSRAEGGFDASLDQHATGEKLLLFVEPFQGDLGDRDIAHALASLKPVDQFTRLVADGPCDHRLLAGGRSELLGNDFDLPDPRRFVWLARSAALVFHETPLPAGSSAVG